MCQSAAARSRATALRTEPRERCAEGLVARAGDFGLPARPATLRLGVPEEHIGERVIPPHPPLAARKKKRRPGKKRRPRAR